MQPATSEHLAEDETLPGCQDLTICGQNVGTCCGWDQADTLIFTFYKVKFNEAHAKLFNSAQCDYLNVDYDKGVITLGSDDAGDLNSFKAEAITWSNYDA